MSLEAVLSRIWVHKGKAAALFIIGFLVIGYFALPLGMPGAKSYFAANKSRPLQPDEVGQMINIKNMYQRMANTGDDFPEWNTEMQDFWKYTIAFSSYGIPSAIILDPENEDEYRLLFDTMIWKMKSRRVWGDFTDRGFGPDPISIQNIMYKGHLNLMYGLYQLSTGDDRYAREYTWLSGQLAEEMRLHHEGIYEGVTCEPNAWFVECNTIGMLSLHIYDRLYGTTYTENEVQWSLDFIMSRMRDEETGLFYKSYHPHQDVVRTDTLGYANAWILTFLNPFLPEEMAQTYKTSFKNDLVVGFGPFYASVRHDLRSNPDSDQTAHIFGLWAAKEFKDPTLFARLRNAVDKFGKLRKTASNGGLNYSGENANLMNGVVLAAKMHLGWDVVLNHDWQHDLPDEVPDTTDMTWQDILPDRVYAMNDGGNPLPQNSISERSCPNCFWGDYESIRMRQATEQKAACYPDDEAGSCGMSVLSDGSLN